MDNTTGNANTYTLQSEIYREMNDNEDHCSVDDDTLGIKSKLFIY